MSRCVSLRPDRGRRILGRRDLAVAFAALVAVLTLAGGRGDAAAPAAAPGDLQRLVDATPSGGTLRPPPGTYAGGVTIDRPIALAGGGGVVIDGRGTGTVVTIRTRGASLTGVRIVGSGESVDRLDAGVRVEGDANLVADNDVDDVLFGIVVHQGIGNTVRGNRVRGKALPVGERGDGLRLWLARDTKVEGNRFERVRDLTLANSPDNRVVGNRLRDGRYGMHVVFSPRTLVERNDVAQTSTGIVVLYSRNLVVRGNRVVDARDAGGGGLAFKESGEALVEGNEIVHCSVGLSANAPLAEDAAIDVRGNRFAHNTVGMWFYGEQGGHRIVDNRFQWNLTTVAVSGAGTASANVWHGNHWDDYAGFDRDGDGVGDLPHDLYAWADRIWMELPQAKFFANSPALELIDFLERLAPFVAPARILRDPKPRISPGA